MRPPANGGSGNSRNVSDSDEGLGAGLRARRLAQAVVRWRWAIVAAWVGAGALAAGRAPRVLEVLSAQSRSELGTEAFRAGQVLRTRFGKPLSDYFAITLSTRDGLDRPPARVLLDSINAALSRQAYVAGVVSYSSTHDSMFVSPDGKTTFLLLALQVPSQDSAGGLVTPVRRLLDHTLRELRTDSTALRVRVTGLAPLDLDIRTLSAADSKRNELRLLPLALVVLVLAFGTLVAAFFPLVIGVLAIWITLALVWVVGHHIPLSVFVLNMTTMLGLGMGIDYSLLIITRFRRELGRGLPPEEAAVVAIETAGMAVLISGMTVVVGLASLLLTPIVETRSVAVGGLIVVAVTVALSITLLPALLAILGREINRPYWLVRRLASRGGIPAAWTVWAEHMRRRPRRALFIGTVVMGLLAAPVFWIRTGLPARDWWPLETEAGQGVATLERMGAGSLIVPIRVLVAVPPGQAVISPRRLRGLRMLSDSLHADPRVGQVRSVVDLKPGTSLLEYALLYSDLPRARAEHPAFLDAYLSVDGRTALLDVLLADTSSLTSALDVTRRARRLAISTPRGLEGASIMVGGYPAEVLDISDVVAQRLPYLIAVVLVVTGVMLGVAFQSVLVPIKAVLMNTLSIAATFGLIVLVFQFGVGGTLFGLSGPTSNVFFLAPVLVFPVVFGLSMDYEVFLLSAMKERFDATRDNSRATAEGLAATASTITWAALIMILVFGSFAFARTLAVQFLGFGLAVAVLLDATLIRLVIVPAFMQLAGRWNWWPGVRTARLPSTKP